jgi:hypothetical protein
MEGDVTKTHICDANPEPKSNAKLGLTDDTKMLIKSKIVEFSIYIRVFLGKFSRNILDSLHMPVQL